MRDDRLLVARTTSWPRVTDLLILSVPAWASPMQIWANNPVGVNHPARLVLVGLVPWVVASGSMLLAQRSGARREQL